MTTSMMKASLLAAAVAALAAAGCSATREIVEPPADQLDQSSAPAAPGLSLGLVVNDSEAVVVDESGGRTPLSKYKLDAEALNELPAGLRRDFKTVQRLDNAGQARSKGVDLVATAKLEYFQVTDRGQYDRYRVSLDFADLNGAPVDSVKADGKSMDFQDNGYGINPGNTFARARERAMKFLRIALHQSEALKAYKPGRRAPAAAPAAEPASEPAPAPVLSKSYRSDADAPAFSRPEDDSKFAVIVGVEKYSDLPPAEHAVRDAKAMKAHLLALGYPERNIIYLTDQKALKTGLEKYVESWLPRNVDEKSTVFFYFSGHGAPDPVTGEAYLVPWDGDPKFLDTTGYPVKRLYSKLNALKAKKILVAMDSCFSGVGGRSVIASGTRPLVGKVDTGASLVGRVASLTASASDEISGIDEASGHGLFTYQLLKALNARSGKATMKELFDALSPKVRDAARRDNRDQTPQLIGNGAASL